MKHIHKIELTEENLHAIIRKHFNIDVSDDLEVNLVEKHEQQPDTGWIDVPFDWNSPCCPAGYSDNTRIDVKFYDGEVFNNIGTCYYRNAWIQEGKEYTIVKYRISKDSYD